MPIEIRELIITATVLEQEKEGANAQAVAPAAGGKGAEGKKEIVQECVEQVMEILSKKMRR